MANNRARRTVPVTERALLQRINRKLALEDQVMKKARTWTNDLGIFYMLDKRYSVVASAHCNLEDWGNKLGVLKPYEHLES